MTIEKEIRDLNVKHVRGMGKAESFLKSDTTSAHSDDILTEEITEEGSHVTEDSEEDLEDKGDYV